MSLTRAQVKHIAKLAHLSLNHAEISLYQEQLSTILDYAERLQELDTDAIHPTATVLPTRSVMRTDKIKPSMAREELLQNAPKASDGMFQVPVILD